MDKAIETIMNDDENIITSTEPDLKSFVLNSLIGSVFLFLIGYGIESIPIEDCEIDGEPAKPEECKVTLEYMAWAMYIYAIGWFGKSLLTALVTSYAVTDQRTIIKTGLIGSDIRSLRYEDVKDVYVNVGLVGKIFGTGRIEFDYGTSSENKNMMRRALLAIPEPYEVYKKIQKQVQKRDDSQTADKIVEAMQDQ